MAAATARVFSSCETQPVQRDGFEILDLCESRIHIIFSDQSSISSNKKKATM